MRFITCAFFLLFALPVAAQTLPDRENPNVNDFAGILGEDAEGQLGETIERLRVDRGVDAVLVTIDRLAAYGDDETIESFATRLFNAWGMGVEGRGDGVLILFARADRGIRVELGPDWPEEAQDTAQRVIDAYYIPDFRRGAFEEGLLLGTGELISRYYDASADAPAPTTDPAQPAAEAETTTTEQPAAPGPAAPAAEGGGGGFPWIWAVVAAIAGLIGWRVFAGGTKCPECGKKGLKVERTTITAPTAAAAGQQKVTTTCPHCSHSSTEMRTLAKKADPDAKEPAAKGDDGKSKGGGASGSW